MRVFGTCRPVGFYRKLLRLNIVWMMVTSSSKFDARTVLRQRVDSLGDSFGGRSTSSEIVHHLLDISRIITQTNLWNVICPRVTLLWIKSSHRKGNDECLRRASLMCNK